MLNVANYVDVREGVRVGMSNDVSARNVVSGVRVILFNFRVLIIGKMKRNCEGGNWKDFDVLRKVSLHSAYVLAVPN